MNADNMRAGQEMSLRQREIELRMGDRQEALNDRAEGRKITALNATLRSLQQQQAQAQEERDNIYKTAKEQNWNESEYATAIAPAEDKLSSIESQIYQLSQSSYQAQGVDIALPTPTKRSIKPLVTNKEISDARVKEARQRFIDDPYATRLSIDGVEYERDKVMTETRRSVDADGGVSTTEIIKGNQPVKARPPGLPTFNTGTDFNQ
jgi:septal ring factor EnvC (AmiA/AmiB activator)